MRLRRAGGTLPIGGVPPALRWLYVMRQLQHEAVSRFFETRHRDGSVEKVGVASDPKRVGPASKNLEYG